MYYVKQLLSDDNSIYYDMLKDGLQGDYNIIAYRKHYDIINNINDDIAAYLNTSKDNIKFYEIEKTVQYTKIIYKEVM